MDGDFWDWFIWNFVIGCSGSTGIPHEIGTPGLSYFPGHFQKEDLKIKSY